MVNVKMTCCGMREIVWHGRRGMKRAELTMKEIAVITEKAKTQHGVPCPNVTRPRGAEEKAK